MKTKADRIYLSAANKQLILDEMKGTDLTFTQATNQILTKVALMAQGDRNDKTRTK